jgi:hypothetical protein
MCSRTKSTLTHLKGDCVNLKKTIIVLLVLVVLVISIGAYFWTFKRNETLNFIINSPISLLITKGDQADPEKIWPLILNHQNPASFRDDFNESELNPIWDFVNLNGKGIVTKPPVIHAANAEIIDGHLVLSVLHDPDFDSESSVWKPGQAAAEQYNNAYIIGFGHYSPTPTENIVIETKFAVTPGFHGSTGLWVEEQGTFDSDTGVFNKPFRSFGVSYLGPDSNTPFDDLQLEAVVGFVPVCTKKVSSNIDVTQENVYKMVWSIVDEKQMKVDLFINGQYHQSCTFPSFYSGELQGWGDNYLVNGLDIGYLNVPEGTVDQIKYDYVSVTVVSK